MTMNNLRWKDTFDFYWFLHLLLHWYSNSCFSGPQVTVVRHVLLCHSYLLQNLGINRQSFSHHDFDIQSNVWNVNIIRYIWSRYYSKFLHAGGGSSRERREQASCWVSSESSVLFVVIIVSALYHATFHWYISRTWKQVLAGNMMNELLDDLKKSAQLVSIRAVVELFSLLLVQQSISQNRHFAGPMMWIIKPLAMQ